MVLKGRDLLGSPTTRCAQVRGNDIAMIFQDPMTSLNPVFKVGDADRRSDQAPPGQEQARRLEAWPSSCSARWASRTPRARVSSTRTSSRAACGSGR